MNLKHFAGLFDLASIFYAQWTIQASLQIHEPYMISLDFRRSHTQYRLHVLENRWKWAEVGLYSYFDGTVGDYAMAYSERTNSIFFPLSEYQGNPAVMKVRIGHWSDVEYLTSFVPSSTLFTGQTFSGCLVDVAQVFGAQPFSCRILTELSS